MKKELSPNAVVKTYKKHGIKITIMEAEHILSFMDNMIQAVKKRFMENHPDEGRTQKPPLLHGNARWQNSIDLHRTLK